MRLQLRGARVQARQLHGHLGAAEKVHAKASGTPSPSRAAVLSVLLREGFYQNGTDDVKRALLAILHAADAPPHQSLLNRALVEVEAWFMRGFLKSPPLRTPPRFLNLGCGEQFARGWLNADFATPRRFIQGRPWPEWNMDATRQWMCPDDYFDAIHCEHVLEHFPYTVSLGVIQECYRTLRPGGILRVIVPDLAKFVAYYRGEPAANDFSERYGSGVVAVSALTQLHFHMSVWDEESVTQTLEEIGFSGVGAKNFLDSSIPASCIDNPAREWESAYVDAVK